MYELRIKATEYSGDEEERNKGVELSLPNLLLLLGLTSANESSLIFNDVPVGIIDGSNRIFTLSFAPFGNTLLIYKNGLYQTSNNDYVLLGANITFTVPPFIGDALIAALYMRT